MRIVIDMQGAQSESRLRGIGRYTLKLAQAIIRNRGEHEVILALSGLFPDTIEPIRAAFNGLLPQENIRVWYAPGRVQEKHPGNDSRREIAELIREAFLASLNPDVIHISSLFEGYVDDAVTSIGRFDRASPVIVTLYDPIPSLNQDHYLKPNASYERFYLRKVEHLKQAAICLTTSQSPEQEGIRELAVANSSLINLAQTIDQRHHHIANQLDSEIDRDDDFISVLPQCNSDFWGQCAIKAIDAFVSVADHKTKSTSTITTSRRPRLAFVSPLPPERTGIADYSAELLPALAVYYDIEVVVAQDRVDDPWVNRHGKIRDVNWLRANAADIDRVLYHIGNSPFHQHMLPLLREIPGVVVLHDFFIGHLKAWMEQVGTLRSGTESLYSAHGYSAVRHRHEDPEAAKFKYPANFGILQHAHGLIFHSEHAHELVRSYYGNSCAAACEVIPLLRTPASVFDQAVARKKLGIGDDDFVVCSFGFMGPTKLNRRLLDCWLNSALARDESCRLVFVGEKPCGEYSEGLLQTIFSSDHGDRISITGFASEEMYRLYLTAADVAVQLRTQSRGETSAAVLDCMNFALPLIVNANGSMAELDSDALWMLPDEFDDSALVKALETLRQEPQRRRTLGELARKVVLSRHAPAECAKRYAEAIERFHKRAETAASALIRAIAEQRPIVSSDAELLHLAKSIAVTLPLLRPAKRLFLDVTATCRNDLKTGIERVARALLLALLETPPAGYRIEPVYLSNIGGEWRYRYARSYTLGLLGCPPSALNDEVVEPDNGDVLLSLDLSGDMLVQASEAGLFVDYRNRGVIVYSMVFDLLPVRMPDVFPPGANRTHARWLQTVSKFDGAICISKAVADDLAAWQAETGFDWKDRRPFGIDWFHLGADVANSAPSRGMPDNAEWTLRELRSRPSFLMVGTIEVRKGYLQTIEAFSKLWSEGADVNLVIVGKEGWKHLPDDMRRDIPNTIERLRTHPELNKRLFWLEGISDECLEKVYAASTCLIAASYGEGFGLPLIEAAQHKLPIIARDIPVFREVAEESAFYFKASTAVELAHAIADWLGKWRVKNVPLSDSMRFLTWKQSIEQLIRVCLSEKTND